MAASVLKRIRAGRSGRGRGGVYAEPELGLRNRTHGSQGWGFARPRSGPAPSGHSDIAQAGKHGAGSSQSLETLARSPIAPFPLYCRVVRPEHPKRRRSLRQSASGTRTCSSLGGPAWSPKRAGDPGERRDSSGKRGDRASERARHLAAVEPSATLHRDPERPDLPWPAKGTLRRLPPEQKADAWRMGALVRSTVPGKPTVIC